jgi:uncharacterized peroxidase-related enzyme
MPLVAPLSDAQASAPAQGLFHEIQAKFGMVPNIFRTMGHTPDVLRATLGLNQAIQKDLDPKLRELAYLKCSQINSCQYCQHYHQGAAKQVGLGPAQVQELATFEESDAYSPLEKAVLRFAEQWTQQGRVEAPVLEELRRSLTPAQLVVLAATVGLANWTNRFNETFGIELP